MGDRRCCCCGCPEYTDDFNRDDSNIVGELSWTEADEPNDPTLQRIVSNTLEITTNWVRYNTPAPGVPVNISVKLLTISDQQEYGVRFGWDIVNNDYFLVTYRSRGPGVAGQVRIYSVSGGVETLTYDSDGEIPGPDRCPGIWIQEDTGETDDDTITLHICYTGSAVRAHTQSEEHGHSCCLGEADGRYVGLEARPGNTLPIRFDDFFMQDHYLHDTRCPSCFCLPMDFCPAPSMTLTIYMLTNPEGCTTDWTDGDSVTMTRMENLFHWYVDGALFTCYEISNPQGDRVDKWFYVRVMCGGDIWALQYLISPTEYTFCQLQSAVWNDVIYSYSVSIDPFIVEFRIPEPGMVTPCCAWSFDGVEYHNCGGFTIRLILTQ